MEELCQQLNSGGGYPDSAKKKIAARTRLPEEFNILSSDTLRLLIPRFEMSCNANGKGKISISFGSEEELEHIMEVMDKMK